MYWPPTSVTPVNPGVSVTHQRVDVFRACRQRVQQIVRRDDLFADVLCVHERRGAADRDRLFQRADGQLGVHRGGEARRQCDSVPFEAAESGEGKCDCVRAGLEVNDVVAAFAVGRGGPSFFDQRGARSFDRERLVDLAGDAIAVAAPAWDLPVQQNTDRARSHTVSRNSGESETLHRNRSTPRP